MAVRESMAPSACWAEVAVRPVDDDLVGGRETGGVAKTARASHTVTRYPRNAA